MKNWLKKYILSLRKDLVIILLADIAYLLLMELVFRKIPSPYPIFAKIGDVSVTLAISFIASFIFYFVQVHFPEVCKKMHIYPCVAVLFHRILIQEKALLTKYVGVQTFEDLNEEIIRNGANKRFFNSQDAPLHISGLNRNANWMEFCIYKVDNIDKTWEMIMKYAMYLDSKFISIMAKIQEDSLLLFFRKMIGIYKTTSINYMNGIDELFITSWNNIQEQEQYYNEVLVKYKS